MEFGRSDHDDILWDAEKRGEVVVFQVLREWPTQESPVKINATIIGTDTRFAALLGICCER